MASFGDMSRNAGSDENGRFYEISLTILTKFLFLWKFAHQLHFNRLEGAPEKLANLAKAANLAKVAILVKFCQGC